MNNSISNTMSSTSGGIGTDRSETSTSRVISAAASKRSSSARYNYFTSSVGKKQILALSAVSLCVFSAVHLLGNTLIFFGPEYFNAYGHALEKNPFLPVAEGGLLALFLVHICLALYLFVENKLARPQGYYLKVRSGRGATFASSTMIYTGLIMLLFLVYHLLNFRFGPVYTTTLGGVVVRDFYRLMLEFFGNPLNLAGYVAVMIIFSFHLGHGIQSIFPTPLPASHCNLALREATSRGTKFPKLG
ncbi:MAG: succinate dehydrogenase cytochrome b subunit [Oligoflexia bacterium]|nr:succinate dehydrogenase cytochrome b subunit [Oligoflexia bacterium]